MLEDLPDGRARKVDLRVAMRAPAVADDAR
jgi:hypothetical protein